MLSKITNQKGNGHVCKSFSGFILSHSVNSNSRSHRFYCRDVYVLWLSFYQKLIKKKMQFLKEHHEIIIAVLGILFLAYVMTVE